MKQAKTGARTGALEAQVLELREIGDTAAKEVDMYRKALQYQQIQHNYPPTTRQNNPNTKRSHNLNVVAAVDRPLI